MAKSEKSELTQLEGVGPATIEKLATVGIDNILGVAVAHPATLVEVCGMTEPTARKIIKAAREKMGFGFVDGITQEESLKISRISTNSKKFDAILDGGIKSGGITEVYGQFGSGKTQLGHQLTVNVLLDNPKGVVVYIDTENTFSAARIRQMSRAKKADEEDILKRVYVAKAYNSDHQIFLSEQIESLFKQEKQVVLIVVDSVMAHFRAEYVGRGTLADRQQKLNKHLHTLQKIADIHNIPVFVTNQVTTNVGVMFGNPEQAIGGNILSHTAREIIYLRKGKAGSRVAKLVDSNYLQDAEVSYIVTEDGIQDLEE